MSKAQGNFKLKVIEGEFTDSQIIVMLGENGTGKTTFIRMLVNAYTYMFTSLHHLNAIKIFLTCLILVACDIIWYLHYLKLYLRLRLAFDL